MRMVLVLASVGLLGACSVVDRAQLGGSPRAATDKIFLGDSRISVPARDLGRYACEQGAMRCELRGTTYDCRCPR